MYELSALQSQTSLEAFNDDLFMLHATVLKSREGTNF